MSEVLSPDSDDKRKQATSLAGGPPVSDAPKLNLRRLETIQRWLQYGALLTLIVFLALIASSWFQLRRINRDIASAEKSLRQKKIEFDELEKKTADVEARYAATVKLLNKTLTRSTNEQDPGQAEKTKQSIEDSISLTANSRQLPARVYLQVGSEAQRERAGEVARQLQTMGYIVPGLEQKSDGIENVRNRAPLVSQIRYYQNDEVSQKDVNDIVNLLKSMRIQLKTVQLPASANVRPRHYEIWFGNDF